MDEPSLPVLGLVAFLTANLASFAMLFFATRIAWQSVALKLPNSGRLYRSNAARVGGVAILPAALTGMLLTSADPRSLLGIVVCATVITGIGLADDIWDIPAVGKLAGQSAVAVAAVAFGVQIEVVSNPFGGAVELEFVVGAALTVFWLVGMMNAINLLDGLDGLAPGVVLVAALTLSLLSANLGNGALAVIGLALAGSITGFLPFNAYRAKIILGDSGSNLLGFLIGTFAVLGQAKIGTALLVLGIPILDVAWTIIRRFRSGRGIMSRDTEHLHHRLLDSGLTRPQVTIVYVLLCAAFGTSALLLERAEKLIALGGLGMVTAGLVYLGVRRSRSKN